LRSIRRAIEAILEFERVRIRKGERARQVTGGEADVRPLDEISCGLDGLDHGVVPGGEQTSRTICVNTAGQ
jgi:hypothetical protein